MEHHIPFSLNIIISYVLYTTPQSLLYCGTWNVNAKGKDEGLEGFLLGDWGPNNQYAPDLIAVGFQEIVDFEFCSALRSLQL